MACCSSGGTDWCVFQAVGIDTLAKRSAIIFSSGGIFPKSAEREGASSKTEQHRRVHPFG